MFLTKAEAIARRFLAPSIRYVLLFSSQAFDIDELEKRLYSLSLVLAWRILKSCIGSFLTTPGKSCLWFALFWCRLSKISTLQFKKAMTALRLAATLFFTYFPCLLTMDQGKQCFYGS